MSPTNNYIPNGDSERAPWLNNFKNKLPLYASTLNLSAADLQQVEDDATMFIYIINMLNSYKQTTQNIVAFKAQLKHQGAGAGPLGNIPVLPTLSAPPTAVAGGVFDRISKLVARIKNSANYNISIGQDLNIIATVPVVDVNSLQPVLKINLDAGRPHIKWQKGYSDALDLQVDRGDGNGFVNMGRFLTPDFIDTTNLSGTILLAQWSYKGIYVIGNNPVGLYSLTETVVVKKQ